MTNHGITVTDHDAREWSRLAGAAYSAGRNEIGHRYSVAAACLHRRLIPCAQYDALAIPYRAWLTAGEWPRETWQ